MMEQNRTLKLALLMTLALLAMIVVFLSPPLPQDPAYHNFADQRTLLGTPNFWNVFSNLPLIIVGLFGLLLLARGPAPGGLPELKHSYFVFFLGVMLTGCASAYYHLDPSTGTLVWDRLPMTLCFMAFFAIIVGENVAPRLGSRLLWPLVGAGIASVLYWDAMEIRGSGDLRYYVLVQFLPMVLAPMILLLFRASLSGIGYVWAVLGAYGLAKVAEVQDGVLFSFLGVFSGHSLKHLLAALGTYCFLLALKRRRPSWVAL